jgi:hypothetical protein
MDIVTMQQFHPSKPKDRPLSKMVILFLLVVILTSICGCIHIDFGDPFKSPEQKPTEFQVITKPGFPVSHTFDIENDEDVEESKTQPFHVLKYTEWVNISIEVTINNFELINSSVINSSILERYVHVTIKGPEGLYLDQKFIESTKILRPLIPPTPGKWIVSVDARGFGYSGTYDSFKINVVAYEPK